jgi:DNA-binding beta-propeller fold protein YncE
VYADLLGASARKTGVNRRTFLLAAAAAPFSLAAADPAPARRSGGTPLALVTADRESRIVPVVLGTGERLRPIPTLPGPRSIESSFATTAIVAHTSEGAVSIVDGVRLRVRHVLRGFGEPRYTAVGAEGLAYVTDSKLGELVVLDLERGRVVGRVELPGPARHVTIEPVTRTLWVALGSAARELAVVDATLPWRPRLRRLLRAPFRAHDVGFAPDGSRVWVTSGDRARIAVFDTRRREPLFQLEHGAPPQHVTLGRKVAYVTSGKDGFLTVHRLADGHVLRRTPIPVGSYNLTRDWNCVLTPSLDRGTLTVLNERGTLLERNRVALAAHDAAFVMSA